MVSVIPQAQQGRKNKCAECHTHPSMPMIEIEGTDGDGYQTLTLVCRDCLTKALGLLTQEEGRA